MFFFFTPQVFSEEKQSLIFNKTVTKTWVEIANMIPGTAYKATVSGRTSKGWGPESPPLTFTLPKVVSTEQSMDTLKGGDSESAGAEYPAFSVETNYYLIVGIVSASLILSMFLFAAVFFIYRHRRKSKANPYFGKSKKIRLLFITY